MDDEAYVSDGPAKLGAGGRYRVFADPERKAGGFPLAVFNNTERPRDEMGAACLSAEDPSLN